MASFPVALVEARASGRPTSAPPAEMGDFLMMPEVALTSDRPDKPHVHYIKGPRVRCAQENV